MMSRGRIFSGILPALLALHPATSHAQAGPGFRDVSEGLTSQLGPISSMITALAFLVGIGLIMIGLSKFKKYAERPQDDASRPLVAIIFVIAGAAVIALPSSISSGVATLFGGDAPTATAYGGGTQVLPFVSRSPNSWGGN